MKHCLGLILAISVDIACASSWEETTGYVDDLHHEMPDSICIAIAKIDPIEVKKYIVGDCSDDSLFQIGTITKTFTSLLLADAVLSGKVTLETPIGEILGALSVKPNDPSITLLDLATHTSGLPRKPDNLRGRNQLDPYRYYGETQLHSFLQDHQSKDTPGEHFRYSSVGISLLGYLITVVQGQSYADLIKTRITDPLGMRSTFVVPSDENKRRILPGHDNLYSQVPDWQLNTMAPALAIYSTLDDMVTYVQANLAAPEGALGERLALSKKSHRSTGQSGGSVGFGWMIKEFEDQRVNWHNGNVGGHKGFIGFMDGFETGTVVLSNAVFSEIDILGSHLLNTAVSLPEIAGIDGSLYVDYLGTYNGGTQIRFKVSANSHTLYLQATGRPRRELVSLSEDVFTVAGSDTNASVYRGKHGEVVAIELREGDVILQGKKAGRELDRAVMRIERDILERYVGNYRLNPEIMLQVSRAGNQLSVQITGQEIQRVFPSTKTRFFVEGSDVEIEFNGSRTRPASSLTLIQEGRQRAKRY